MAGKRTKRPLPVGSLDVRARVLRGPREDGRWYWRIHRTVHRRQEALGGGWWHAHEAERATMRLAADEDGGATRRPAAATVGELLHYWIGAQELRADLSPRTLEVRRAACRWLLGGMGDTLIGAVDRVVLERHRDRRLREAVTLPRKRRDADGNAVQARNAAGKLEDVWDPHDTGRTTAPRTVQFELLVLRMAWRYGREVGLVVGELPVVGVRVRGHVRNRYTPTPIETAAVMRHLDGWAQLALLLYAGTGARLDEIASLTWGDVDLDVGEVHVTGKMGRRTVPIEPPIVRALRDLGPGEPTARVLACAHSTARAIYERLDVACRKAGVPRFAPGGLRRAAVGALYRAGDPSVAGAVLGHSAIVAMRHYREVGGQEKRDAMRAARLGHLPDPDAKVVELPARRKHR